MLGKKHFDGDVTDDVAAQVIAAPQLPLKLGNDNASRLIRAWQARNRWFTRHPDCLQLGYVEALNPDFTPNDDIPNHFDAVRVLVRIEPDGTPKRDVIDGGRVQRPRSAGFPIPHGAGVAAPGGSLPRR